MNAARTALIRECTREEENCLYTSTSFFVWVRCLRWVRGALWIGAVAASAVAASHILRGDPSYRILMAAAALGAVLLPGIGRAVWDRLGFAFFQVVLRNFGSSARAAWHWA